MVEFFYVLIGQRYPLDKAAGLRTSRVGWLLAVRPSVAATGRISAGPQLAMCLTGVRRRLRVYLTPYDAGITSAATDSVMVTCTVCPGFSVRRNFCISGVFASTI